MMRLCDYSSSILLWSQKSHSSAPGFHFNIIIITKSVCSISLFSLVKVSHTSTANMARKETWDEPKIPWKKSEAKKQLYELIMNGEVPLQATDVNGRSTMPLSMIYLMNPEFRKYHYSKFSSRLSSLRKTIVANIGRSEEDLKDTTSFVQNHPASLHTHRGEIQWQNSRAQQLLLYDIKRKYLDEHSFAELYLSRPEYYKFFELKPFRKKFDQEINTAKYKHTLKVKGKFWKAS